MLQPGTQVDRYVVEHLIGRGGQAEVYRVRHHLLGTRHALKVLHGASDDLRARLVREGRVQARLDPSYVLPVHDIISVQGAPALILPFVSGCSLDELLLDHRPVEGELIALFLGICEGVRCAHAAGIVHRDLKPANVMLEDKRGRILVRVADFGLAQTQREPTRDDGFDPRRTRAGMVMGSPAYAAPEQLVDAARVDHRADLWSLGVLLFELLTGDLPFQAATMLELVRCVRAGVFDDSKVAEAWKPLVHDLISLSVESRPDSIEQIQAAVSRLGTASALTLDSAVAEVVRRRAASKADRLASKVDQPLPQGPTIAPGSQTVDLDSLPAMPTMVPVDSQSPQHNLPVERDAFVGRQADLAALDAHVTAGVRLLSVVGAGGSGKTRLILHHGWNCVDAWPGGVWFCDLSGARDLEGVAYAVSRALDVPLGAGDPIQRLGHAMAGRGRCLVLLDNAEQVHAEVRRCLEHWLDRAAEVRFVVTTRVVLGIAGEQTLPLPPLPPVDAAELFRLRARAAGRALGDDSDEANAIDELVTLLDHLPLAIELAAARSRVLSPRQLLTRMAHRFRVLTSKGGRADRHATLRATLAWSWDLLDGWEQATLAQLSVFQGGFDLEAAEQVVAVDDQAPWTLDLVQSLVDKSLVRAVDDDRFTLLMSVQAFAAEALASSGDPDTTARRHGAWFSELGRIEALEALYRHDGVARRAAMVPDLYNLVAANRWAVARGDVDIACPTAMAAWALLALSGPFRTGADLLEASCELPGLSPEQEVFLRRRLGWAQELLGLLEPASDNYERVLTLARSTSDRLEESRVLGNIGNLHRLKGRRDQALTCHQRALDLAVELGDRPTAATGHGNVAVMLQHAGRFDEARAAYDRAITIAREIGDVHRESMFLGNLATFHGVRGELDAALPLFERALGCARQVGARRSQGIVLANLGLVHQQQGRADRAEEHFRKALKLANTVGDRLQQAACLGYLGTLAQAQGRNDTAEQHHKAMLEIALETGSLQREGMATGHLGQLDRVSGRLDRARRRLQRALQAHRETGSTYRQPVWLAELALLDVQQDRLHDALVHVTDAVSLAGPYPVVHAQVRAAQARVLLARGEVSQAREAVEAGHRLQQSGAVEGVLWAVDALVAAEEGDLERTRLALRHAAAHAEHDLPGTETHRLVQQVRQRLPPTSTAPDAPSRRKVP